MLVFGSGQVFTSTPSGDVMETRIRCTVKDVTACVGVHVSGAVWLCGRLLCGCVAVRPCDFAAILHLLPPQALSLAGEDDVILAAASTVFLSSPSALLASWDCDDVIGAM